MKNALKASPAVFGHDPTRKPAPDGFKPVSGVFKDGLTSAANSGSGSRTDGVASIGVVSAINQASDNWFLIAPYGEHGNVVGLQLFDRQAADACVRAFNGLLGRVGRLFRGLPIYVGHPDYTPTSEAYPDKTEYGQITGLEARADGLWARAKWRPEGRAMVNEGDFRFQSPHWGMQPVPGREGVYRPVELFSIGLTNSPNLPVPPLPAQNQQPNPSDTMNKKKLAKLLKLQPAANAAEVTDAQIEEAVEALAGQAETSAGAVSAANTRATTLEANLTAANERITEAESARDAALDRATRAEASRNEILVTGAINEGRITAADRAAWLGKLAGDFATQSKELAALKPALNTKPATKELGGRKSEAAAGNPIGAINDAVAKHMKETGQDYSTAFAAVKSAQPALFEQQQAAA